MELQARLEVQAATQQWVAAFMNEYGVPADVMQEALTKVLLQLKDQIITDLLVAAAQAQSEQEQAPHQEEDDG